LRSRLKGKGARDAKQSECDDHAVHCTRQADAQTDPKVKRQFLELKRLWLLLAATKSAASTATH
jgi:hypothetical protein